MKTAAGVCSLTSPTSLACTRTVCAHIKEKKNFFFHLNSDQFWAWSKPLIWRVNAKIKSCKSPRLYFLDWEIVCVSVVIGGFRRTFEGALKSLKKPFEFD
jgi:hypothetical protein